MMVHTSNQPLPRRAGLILARRRPWLCFAAGSVAQVALFYGVGLLGQTSRYLGIPGAAAALFAVVVAVIAGPVTGVAVALVGGVAFVVFVTEFGQFVSPVAIAIAVVLWTLAAVIAGLAAEAVRRRADAREILLSRALDESVSFRRAIEQILAIAPSFHQFEQIDDLARAICSAAQETFGSRAASLYRSDGGHVTLLYSEPPTPLMTPGRLVDAAAYPGLLDTLVNRTPSFVPDALTETWSEAEAELARSLNVRSILRVPILLSPTSAYLLVIGWEWQQERDRDPTLLAVAQRFADQAAVALERVEADMLHTRLEKSLLSRTRDPHPGIDIAIRYRAGERRLGMGGDFVDYIAHADGVLSFVIGDVSGHGPDSAALGATLRSGWRAMSIAGIPPEKAIDCLNQVLLSERSADTVYCTLLTGRLDSSTGSLVLANAGHPPPLLVARQTRLLPVTPVLPLGCEHKDGWRLEAFALPEAWSLLLYTDGLFEGSYRPGARERFGLDRLVERFGRAAPGPIPPELLDEVLAEMEQTNGRQLPDDVALLLLSKSS